MCSDQMRVKTKLRARKGKAKPRVRIGDHKGKHNMKFSVKVSVFPKLTEYPALLYTMGVCKFLAM